MKPSRPADDDRLPWLEPYRETMAQERRVARRSHGKLVAYAGALILLFVAAGAGYWFGQLGERPTEPGPSTTIALPAPQPLPPVQVAEAAPPAAETPAATDEPVATAAKPNVKKAARRKAVRHRSAARRKIRNAGIEADRLNAIRASQEKQQARPAPPVRPAWPKMPSPGPAGQVIQLGAFSTPTRAGNAYRARIARYPVLARMPRVIVPVATKPGNRVLYVLRLGTTSRQQSKTVCRNLRRSGDHCLVIG
jgi:pyruvate/2-oxoglutarate dehydrogenase complex dihydrolipoamide acyltransferase (E2) component